MDKDENAVFRWGTIGGKTARDWVLRINPKPAPPANQLNVLSAAEARPLDIEVTLRQIGEVAEENRAATE